MAVHQRNTHSRSRQHVCNFKILLTLEERAALAQIQRKHHLANKNDALTLAIYRLAIRRKILTLSPTDQALCVMNMREPEISKRFRSEVAR